MNEAWIDRLRKLALRLRALLKREQVERELDEELGFHIDMEIEVNRRRGMSPEAARTEALRSFGGVERFKEECREARGLTPLEDLAGDLRYGLRILRKNPAFSGVAVAILALGIGVTTASFSLVHAYLLEPLPYSESERLVYILRGPDRESFASVEGLEDVDWSSLSDVFALQISWDLDGFNLTGGAGPLAVDGAWVDPAYFEALGVKPQLGRVFDVEDARRGERVAVISHGLWQRRFGGDSAVIGRTIRASSSDRPQEPELHTIIGVLPRDFWYFNRFTELLVPLLAERPPYMAKLAQGVGREEAQARLNAVVAQQISGAPPGWHMALVSAHDEHVHRVRPTLVALTAAVALVLLIACANVGGLLVARAIKRRREVAIRAAIGARRGRIVRQLLTESVLLSGLAGVLGVLVAFLLIEVAGAATQDQLGITVPGGLERLELDFSVLAFTLAISLLAGLAFGVLPTIAVLGDEPKDALHESSARGGEGRGHTRGRDALVVAQIALSFALLVGAGLMIRSVQEIQRVDLGFEPADILKAELMLPESEYPDPASRRAFFEEATEAIEGLPGVRRVGLVWPYPFRPGGGRPVTPEGHDGASEMPLAVYHAADPGYFEAMEISLLRGRLFDQSDHLAAPPVVVISESLGERLWPGSDPIGERVKLGPPDSESEWRTVVGVVADVRERLPGEPWPDIYIPHAQNLQRTMFLMVKTEPGVVASAQALQDAIAGVDSDIPVSNVTPMADVVARASSRTRFLSVLLGGLAAFAVLLTATGIYSTLAYAVGRRAREIAIRSALGARGRSVLALIVGQGIRLVAVGLGLGIAAGLLAARILASQVFGVRAADPFTYAAVAIFFSITTLAAMLLPGRQALRLDPARVLREEA